MMVESEENTTTNLQKRGGKGKLTGEDGNTFSSTNQPSAELKKAGWKKRQFSRETIKELLNTKYKFAPNSKIREQLIESYGEEILEFTIGEIMSLQQAQKAILKGDTPAYHAIMNQGLGMPKQEIENSGSEAITIKVLRDEPKPRIEQDLPTEHQESEDENNGI